jgi:hypothetical protein
MATIRGRGDCFENLPAISARQRVLVLGSRTAHEDPSGDVRCRRGGTVASALGALRGVTMGTIQVAASPRHAKRWMIKMARSETFQRSLDRLTERGPVSVKPAPIKDVAVPV